MIDERRWESREIEIPVEQPHWFIRAYQWLVTRYRPDLGWFVFLATVALSWLPALALGENRLTEMRRMQAGVDSIGPVAVTITWLLLGWRARRPSTNRSIVGTIGRWFVFFLAGLLMLSQALTGWLPGIGRLWQTLLTGSWPALVQGVVVDWQQLFTRLSLWWQGVQSGGAAQDSLVFALLAGVVFWSFAALTAWLIRRTQRGLTATLPLLWLLGTLILYTTTNRGLMLAGVALAFVLHLLLDQHRLVQRWQQQQLDYSPDLVIDRAVAIGFIGFVLFLAAAVLPNLYYRPLVVRYYEFIQPVDETMENWRDRLFPDLAGISRRGGAGAGGLPNAFLLGGGIDLGENIIMQVRTNETAFYDGPLYEEPAPPGHYMRGATLTEYDGYGWDNPSGLATVAQNANTAWITPPEEGRRDLVQSITLFVNSPVLYAAPEPVEPGIQYEARLRADGDLVAIQQRARNYTIISSIPAVSEGMLAETAAWDESNPLPDGYAIHLQLPDTITERTRDLAAELVTDQPTMFAQARAIEMFLRQYTYDLEVPEPPTDVPDMADYFLFELQRGYCDYYATAFVVLARLAGIPARFATGYAPGYWNPSESAWTVTESQAHSWPEVYFPDYGWIPFEPTAGRPELTRIGFSSSGTGGGGSAQPLPPPAAPASEPFTWNWQMLFWLLPLGLIGWGLVTLWLRYRQGREDPWDALQWWGRRAGRPLDEGETILEYGRGLADFILQKQTQTQDVGRLVAREVVALSTEVNDLHYGTADLRQRQTTAVAARWGRLRAYLRRLALR